MTASPECIVAIIEARMTSSRLPGKVLLPADGKPMLEHLVNRLRAAPSIERVMIATTDNATDEPLVQLAHRLGIGSFCGSEPDVMQRVMKAARSVDADIIVGVTGDCPLIDPMVTEQVIRLFLNNSADYATNGHIPTYPEGLGVQVYRRTTLELSLAMTADAFEHEHVTLHMRRHPELFRHLYLPAPPDQHWPELHLSLDEEPDYRLLKAIIEHFGPANPLFSCRELVALLKSRPDLVAINQAVKLRSIA
jgi:spore coat polysaccharide biosynthesis protein SpsF